MEARVRVSSTHHIVVPSVVRKQLQIKAGDHLVVVVRNGVAMLIPEPTDPVEQLRGLGREIWEGIDAQEYVDRLRDEW